MCEDTEPKTNCDEWKRQGYCVGLDSDFMRLVCQKTCGLCSDNTRACFDLHGKHEHSSRWSRDCPVSSGHMHLMCRNGTIETEHHCRCHLTCGQTVPYPWTGYDNGRNSCRRCTCQPNGVLKCTEPVPYVPCQDTPPCPGHTHAPTPLPTAPPRSSSSRTSVEPNESLDPPPPPAPTLPVGCDGVVGSYIAYDDCGVCGGDGTTCATQFPRTMDVINQYVGLDGNAATPPLVMMMLGGLVAVYRLLPGIVR